MVKKVEKSVPKADDDEKEGAVCPESSGAEAAHYIADMLMSLTKVAKKEDMKFLVYLLDMACSEAISQRDGLEKKSQI